MTNHQCEIDGCGKDQKARGLCNLHYQRWLRLGHTSINMTEKGEPLRWARKILDNPQDDCIIWPFSTKTDGYGCVQFRGKSTNASRLMLILKTGIDPADMEAAHGPCHNRSCVNPNHLSWKSPKANTMDRMRDGTHGKKLTEDVASQIIASPESQREIAKKFGVSQPLVSAIKRGTVWGHLDGQF